MFSEIAPGTLIFETRINTYTILFGEVDEALKIITKSIHTDSIHDEHAIRMNIFRGMVGIVKSSLRHYNEDVREASKHVMVVIDTYNKISKKPINEVTSAILNLLQDLRGRFAADVIIVGIVEWLNELEKQNNRVNELWGQRLDERNQQSDIVLRTARTKTDDAYRDIIKCIEGMCLIDEKEYVYRELIHKLNVIVEKYSNTLAMRTGRAKGKS
jgi:hypothetical protein